ncbi:hypothetical protein LO80_06280 [Candidatus Francisella endociliophora]|uniref:Type VI lipoprotein IgE-like C-terminal domain-containing protein n=1 Tax=Candidatus Francisella endociliophora TaxID=653937 RepID=A0A097EPW2_9GAMM|nr:type VI secretion system lipoprotein IglE [Francisella sp. FSC1006]AIT09607.1 hypothetical protein LO80_06280 [Francisella sp. FSC1006]
MIKKIKTCLIICLMFVLASCASNTLYVKNSLPKSKVVLEKNPNQKNFYSATYESVSQDIYSDDMKILPLDDGKNKFDLDSDVKDYAVYFILPNIKDSKDLQTWKYLINPKDGGDFTIEDNGSIEKN